MTKKEFNITGMDCNGCANTITNSVSKLEGIKKIEVDYKTGKARIEYDKKKINTDEIIKKIEALGYKAK